MIFSKGTHLVFASFCAGVYVGLARGMPMHARKMWHAGLLTFFQEGLYPHCCTYNEGMAQRASGSAFTEVTPNQGGGGNGRS